MVADRISGWSPRVGRRSARALAVLLATLVATLAVTSQVLAGGSGCADNKSCMWGSPDFQGQKVVVDGSACCNWENVIIGQGVQSAKNNFGDREFKLRFDSSDNVHCLDPGQNRPSPNWNSVDMFKVGTIGSRCP
jgi:hypothetical protein